MMSHHCFLLHISRMKADRNIISSVPGPLDMSSPWAMSISQTLGGLSEQISPLRAGHCLKLQRIFLNWKPAFQISAVKIYIDVYIMLFSYFSGTTQVARPQIQLSSRSTWKEKIQKTKTNMSLLQETNV